MTTLAFRQMPPSADDAALARASSQLLSRYASKRHSLTLSVREAGESLPIELPAGAVRLLADILQAMAAGQGITLIPENAELTTVQAADLLNVSRPFLIRLLEEGTIPYRKVGTHRRLRLEDVMKYREHTSSEREKVLTELTREAQEQGMGY